MDIQATVIIAFFGFHRQLIIRNEARKITHYNPGI